MPILQIGKKKVSIFIQMKYPTLSLHLKNQEYILSFLKKQVIIIMVIMIHMVIFTTKAKMYYRKMMMEIQSCISN